MSHAKHLLDANQVALAARAAGHHPFGALLVAPDGETVLMRQGNIDTVNHAESTLAREAYKRYEPAYLWQCTLVTTVEPCAMCAATQYWANVGRLVYGLSERQLLDLTGAHDQNPTMDLPCREVFTRTQKSIEVVGPVAEQDASLQAALLRAHAGFW
jgi:tRNA(Arg) A34 adenosine deaminase TadA